MSRAKRIALKTTKSHIPYPSEPGESQRYCMGCPQEDWGHRDYGPALWPCDLLILAETVLGVRVRYPERSSQRRSLRKVAK